MRYLDNIMMISKKQKFVPGHEKESEFCDELKHRLYRACDPIPHETEH